MTCHTTGSESITVERVWNGGTGGVIFKLPSGYPDKVLMVYEDPFDVSVTVVTEEEYAQQVERMFVNDCKPTDEYLERIAEMKRAGRGGPPNALPKEISGDQRADS